MPNFTFLDVSFVNRCKLGDIVKGQEQEYNKFVCPKCLAIVLHRL